MPGLKSLMAAYQLTGQPEEVSTAVIGAAFPEVEGPRTRERRGRSPARAARGLTLPWVWFSSGRSGSSSSSGPRKPVSRT
jgi:hypothetical protein